MQMRFRNVSPRAQQIYSGAALEQRIRSKAQQIHSAADPQRKRRRRCCPNVMLRDVKCALIGAATAGLSVGAVSHLTKPNSTVELCAQSMPIIDHRHELADILEAENKTTGLEVGVKQGAFANTMLSRWKQCQKYILLDPWEHQEHYKDLANVDQETQNQFMQQTMEKMKPFKEKGVEIKLIRDYSSNGHKEIPDDSLDFIYIDARHDYKAMAEDLEWMWPKLKKGGIFAGHDFVNADEEPKGSGQDWCTFDDGTKCKNGEAVKAAVEHFAKKHGDKQIVVPRREAGWPSWYLRK
jgi:hypothetical protein